MEVLVLDFTTTYHHCLPTYACPLPGPHHHSVSFPSLLPLSSSSFPSSTQEDLFPSCLRSYLTSLPSLLSPYVFYVCSSLPPPPYLLPSYLPFPHPACLPWIPGSALYTFGLRASHLPFLPCPAFLPTYITVTWFRHTTYRVSMPWTTSGSRAVQFSVPLTRARYATARPWFACRFCTFCCAHLLLPSPTYHHPIRASRLYSPPYTLFLLPTVFITTLLPGGFCHLPSPACYSGWAADSGSGRTVYYHLHTAFTLPTYLPTHTHLPTPVAPPPTYLPTCLPTGSIYEFFFALVFGSSSIRRAPRFARARARSCVALHTLLGNLPLHTCRFPHLPCLPHFYYPLLPYHDHPCLVLMLGLP